MEGMEEKLNAILGNPQMMQQIMFMAQAMQKVIRTVIQKVIQRDMITDIHKVRLMDMMKDMPMVKQVAQVELQSLFFTERTYFQRVCRATKEQYPQ